VLPPPVGYLKRVREICDKHNILLIFDEVITGFGRLGSAFATTKFDVTPDMITCAKGLTNAAVPCGAVISQKHVFQTIQEHAHVNPGAAVEFYHGYTYRYVLNSASSIPICTCYWYCFRAWHSDEPYLVYFPFHYTVATLWRWLRASPLWKCSRSRT